MDLQAKLTELRNAHPDFSAEQITQALLSDVHDPADLYDPLALWVRQHFNVHLGDDYERKLKDIQRKNVGAYVRSEHHKARKSFDPATDQIAVPRRATQKYYCGKVYGNVDLWDMTPDTWTEYIKINKKKLDRSQQKVLLASAAKELQESYGVHRLGDVLGDPKFDEFFERFYETLPHGL